MRLFVAVDLCDAARRAIGRAIDDFPVTSPPWRWADPATWHITLKFLGETRPDQLDGVLAALHEVAARHQPFELALCAFAGFPNLRAPRVLFFDAASGSEPCAALACDVDTALFDAMGLQRDARRFHAHVTIARVKIMVPDAVAREFALVPPLTDAVTRVDRFRLVESRLRPAGAEYSTVKEFAFSGGRC